MSDSIAEPMDDNDALREILGEVRLLESILRQRYTSVADPLNAQAVTSGAPYVRPADPDAVKVVITNVHASNDATVLEEGALVARLEPGESWVSPLDGSGEITVTADVGSPSTVAVATYRKA